MSRSRGNRITFAVGFLSLVLSAPAAPGQSQAPAATTAADSSSALEATTRLVSPAVVQIFATSYTPREGLVPSTADLITTQRASGSGVIVTNAHVGGGAQRLRVEVPTPVTGQSILATRSRTVAAKIVGIDLEADLAVIRIDERNLPAVSFGDSDELKAGQVVLALGSPLGRSAHVAQALHRRRSSLEHGTPHQPRTS